MKTKFRKWCRFFGLKFTKISERFADFENLLVFELLNIHSEKDKKKLPITFKNYDIKTLLSNRRKRDKFDYKYYDMALIMNFCKENAGFFPDKIYKNMDMDEFYDYYLTSKAINFKERE